MLEDRMVGTHLLVVDKFMQHASTFLSLDLIFDLMYTFSPHRLQLVSVLILYSITALNIQGHVSCCFLCISLRNAVAITALILCVVAIICVCVCVAFI